MSEEYIRKADAIDEVNHALDRETILFSFVRKVAISALKRLPSADVVPVVRCRDCKHLDVKTAGWGICKDANGCGRLCGPNDFCSSGVRKE